jgi:hypothetical protein
MRRFSSSWPTFAGAVLALTLLLCSSLTVEAQSTGNKVTGRASEQKTARYFESIRKSPPQMFAFLKRMPKAVTCIVIFRGRLCRVIYSMGSREGVVRKSRDDGTVIAPCDQAAGKPPASAALTNPVLYRQLIDAWSMRYWQYSGQNGHDHFFDTFGKFGGGTFGQMLAEVSSRAAKGRVSYLELMLTPDGGRSSLIGAQVGWNGDFEGTLSKLKSSNIDDAAASGIKALQDAEAEKNVLLKCGTRRPTRMLGDDSVRIASVARSGARASLCADGDRVRAG